MHAPAWVLLGLLAAPGVLALPAPALPALPPASGVGCTDLTGGHVRVMAFFGVAEFHPGCVEIASGAEVAWTVEDDLSHDPRSNLDGGECFRARYDHGDFLDRGERFAVAFAYDGVEAVATAGGFLRGCQLDDSSTPEVAVIPYHSDRHPNARGTVRVHAA
jgi:plastocyanin